MEKYSEDLIAQKAICRNRVLDPRAKRVALRPSTKSTSTSTSTKVALVIDDEQGTMAAHAPMPAAIWEKCADSIDSKVEPASGSGRILTFPAAVSCNERPERIIAATQLLKESGLASECTLLPLRKASREELCLAHTAAHVDGMLACDCDISDANKSDESEGVIDSRGQDLEERCGPIMSLATACNYVFMNAKSVAAARAAVGGVVDATLAVAAAGSAIKRAACVVRPPGHHSECGCAMGFCLFNAVAVATRAVLRLGQPSQASAVPSPAPAPTSSSAEELEKSAAPIRRVLIVDWDIHHGNGTQQIFANDPNVLYVSAHMYNMGWEYPMCAPTDTLLEWGVKSAPTPALPDYVGEGEGRGTTVNIAWQNAVVGTSGYGDAEYIAAWERVVLPIAREFSPDIVMISAGFDSGAGDECGYGVTPRGYAYLTQRLCDEKSLPSAMGRAVVVLEGGYNIPTIAHGMEACVGTLCDRTDICIDDAASFGRPSAEALRDIQATIDAHKPYWRCLRG